MKKQKQSGSAILLASIPILSLLLQLLFSYLNGDLNLLLRHYTVMYVDFIFVPLNFFIWQAIDWKKGNRIFFSFLIAFTLSCLIHYGWAVNGTDPGHMMRIDGFINPSGWVHIIFSAVEFCLMLLFLFDYQPSSKSVLFLTTFLLELYFISSLISAYFIHEMFLVEDIIRVTLGCAVFAVYGIIRRKVHIPLNESGSTV